MMSSKKAQDLTNFDWDDSALIAAYNESMSLQDKITKSASCSDKLQWKVHDFCRAIYDEDGEYYEAQIKDLSKNGTCVVHFLGYNEEQEASVLDLQRSLGEKGRRVQLQAAKDEKDEGYSRGSDNTSSSTESSSSSAASGRNRKMNRQNRITNNFRQNRVTNDVHQNRGADRNLRERHGTDRNFQERAGRSSDVSSCCSSVRAAAPLCPREPYYAPQQPVAYNNTAAPPMMPQLPRSSADTSFQAALMSWYMAGYYTGLHEGERKNNCRCCHH